MKKEIIISGFGGQGGLAIGKNLAEAGMAEGLFVTWAPSYGPEMRGGTANCSVVLSDKPVGSPVFNTSSELIALNEPSLEKFEMCIRDRSPSTCPLICPKPAACLYRLSLSWPLSTWYTAPAVPACVR